MRVQLITFSGCPNASATREALERVLASVRVTQEIEEINTSDPATPESLRGWGSPTVLINGIDVGGQNVPGGSSCRLYADHTGVIRGVPPESLLMASVLRAVGDGDSDN